MHASFQNSRFEFPYSYNNIIIINVCWYIFFLQLKAYLQEQSITAHVDDLYAASAINKATQ